MGVRVWHTGFLIFLSIMRFGVKIAAVGTSMTGRQRGVPQKGRSASTSRAINEGTSCFVEPAGLFTGDPYVLIGRLLWYLCFFCFPLWFPAIA